MSNNKVSRRTFLNTAALTAAGLTIVPRHVLGGTGFVAPSDKLNIAAVGVGGMGRANLRNMARENIVALCDVDFGVAAPVFKEYPNAKTYKDFRVMFDQQKDIDAVLVATPDHTHAIVASAAMQLGYHVYVQKPLTWSVNEARHLNKLAQANPKLKTQMGNQGHSSEGARLINEWVEQGAIGDVKEVFVWTNRPIWPQGVERPKEAMPVPSTLDWDLYLGPAPVRDYNKVYHPFNWRGWVDYGTGALGDMGAHLIDHPYWALKLGYPTQVETVSTRFNKDSWPLATVSWYDFPARGNMPGVKMTWYDGGLKPARPDELPEGMELTAEGGVLMVGSKGKLYHQTYGSNPILLPESLGAKVGKPKQTYERVPNGERGGHELNWLNAIKEDKKTVSPFQYAAPLTETMLLGVVALRAGGKIQWDGQKGVITNNAAANEFLGREYRPGWKLA